MLRIVTAAAIGITFGIGIAISGMANPAKVLNFFDIAGTWDASLGLVMASALAVAAVGYRFVLKRPRPVFEAKFHLPGNRKLDLPLVAGSAVFGIGWGITGFCPGGAIPALGLGEPSAWIFVGAMLAGIAAARTVRFALQQRATQST
ncbi:MAG: YeeE/YedE thiosulfate transporter family protein [Devosia sp.]|nr:YeeE/YedE thiosulfate transporter family protein [Devosia sp.]